MLPYPEFISPVAFSVGPIEIRWYGIMYILGFAFATFFLRSVIKNKRLPLTLDELYDFIFYAALGVILGGRLGYILFYDPGFYFNYPLEILQVWHGGMSFHGGLLGVILISWWWFRRHHKDFYAIADWVVIPVAVGLALGRIGNFINGELFGRVTDSYLGMEFPNADEPRHPVQLYSVTKDLFLFFILWWLSRKPLPPGVRFWSFIGLYGLGRTIIELFREPDPQLGFIFTYFTVGQLLSLPMFFLGVFMVVKLMRKSTLHGFV